MISEMEETCRQLLKEHFIPEIEWDSVGTHVDIKHLARYSCWSGNLSDI